MTQQKQTIAITWDTIAQAYKMVCPYHEGFKRLFKAAIPDSDRAWNPIEKAWYFAPPSATDYSQVDLKKADMYFDWLHKAAVGTFGSTNVFVESRQAAEASAKRFTVPQVASQNAAEQFLRLVPADALKKAYRAAVMTYHPDRAYSMAEHDELTEKMTQLNTAWDEISKKLGII